MKKLAMLSLLAISLCGVSYASETEVAVEETTSQEIPVQQTQNKKGFAGINYNRQDIEEPGRQVIVNDHSAFNININIFKKGALFKDKKEEQSAQQ